METLKVEKGDIVINSSLRPESVSGIDKLGQTIYELLTINILENGFGSDLYKLDLDARMAITSALSRFKAAQDRSQLTRTKDEKYASLGTLNVVQRGTALYFSMYLYNVVGEEFVITGKAGA